MSKKFSWEEYNENKSEKPPNTLLVETLPYVNSRETALDFGAGALVDSKFLLEEGFGIVVAIDADPDSQKRANEIDDDRFSFTQKAFEDAVIPPNSFDLISAQNVAAFINQSEFKTIISNLLNGLKNGGVISINFFGDQDEWNTSDTTKNFVSKRQIQEMFDGLEIISFEEAEYDGNTALGTPKHWHTINVIAKKV